MSKEKTKYFEARNRFFIDFELPEQEKVWEWIETQLTTQKKLDKEESLEGEGKG